MNVIITGSTGMVGKGVLLECMENNHVNNILVINRNPVNIQHPKLKEIIHRNFKDFSSINEELKDFDACFYCMGVSSVGLNEDKYTEITYSMTTALAETLHELNPGMTFIYVSGMGTDGSEKGRIMWARVKGRTENTIFNMGFKDAYAFRPGFILPEKGIRSRTPLYNSLYTIMRPFFPLLRNSKGVTTTTKVGKAMINSVLHSQDLKILENRDINVLAGL